MAEQEKGNLKIEDRLTNYPKLMQELEAGVIANVIGLALSNVAQAVSLSNKNGEVALKFTIKPGSSSDNAYVEIVSNINVKEPKLNYGAKKEDFQHKTIAFVGRGGKLTYDRPKEDVNGQLNLTEPKMLQEVRG